MIKFILFSILVIGLLLITPFGRKYVNSAASMINPAITERQLLGDLKQHFDAISKTVNQPEFLKLSDTQKVSHINNELNKAGAVLKSSQKIAEKSDIVAGISNIIQKIIPTQNNNPQNGKSLSEICPTLQ